MSKLIGLTALILLTTISGFGVQPRYTYTVKGRIVDDNGKPVPDVSVTLRSPQYAEGDIVYVDSSDQNGNFVVQKKSQRAILNWRLYVSDSSLLPENTHELLSATMSTAFCSNFYKSFCGHKVDIPANRVKNIGDIRLENRQFPVLARLLGHAGNPLISDDGSEHGFVPWWRVRDPLGDVIGEGGNAIVHYRYAESAVMIALPAGKWALEISDANGSNLGGIFNVQVSEQRNVKELNLKLENLDDNLAFSGRKAYLGADHDEARRSILERGFKVSKADFQRRVLLKNHEVVELYLKAGMDPNVLTNNGDVLQAAVESPRVLKLLLEAGADVNRRVKGGYTPLLIAAGSGAPGSSIRMLLDAGADITAKDNEGRDSFELARENNDTLEQLNKYKENPSH